MAVPYVPRPDPASPGLIDTTGSRPEVAECEAAIAAATTGSATLAALPPGLVLGKVFVPKGEQAALDLRGKSVVQIEDLAVEGGSGDKLGCSERGGRLVVRVGAGEQIAVNIIKRLNVGVCSELRVESDVGAVRGFVLLNVVGLGARVRIAGGALASPGVNILAPLRKVEVGQVIDGARFARILGNRLLFRGGAYQDDDPEEMCF